MPIRHLMREIAPPPALQSHQTVMEAVRHMIDFDTGAVVITDVDARVIGIFTKKDLLGKVTALNRIPKTTRLGDVMTTQVVTAHSTIAIADCLRIMNEYGVRHLPIVAEGERYSGMLSLCDLLRDRMVEMMQDISNLEAYFNDAQGG